MARRPGCRFDTFMCFYYSICGLIIGFFVFVIAAFIFHGVFKPKDVRVAVTSATLTQFNFTTNNTLNYNLAVNITLTNPNKKVGIFYDRFQAIASYHKKKFANTTLSSVPFYQRKRNTTTISLSFKGEQVVVLGKKELPEYNLEMENGIYNVDLRLNLKVKARYGRIRPKFKPKINCNLKIPLNSAGSYKSTTICDSIDIFNIVVGLSIGPLSFEAS